MYSFWQNLIVIPINSTIDVTAGGHGYLQKMITPFDGQIDFLRTSL